MMDSIVSNQVCLPRGFSDRPSRFVGAADTVNPVLGLQGWLVDLERIGHGVEIRAVCDGRALATAFAMGVRPDIDKVLNLATHCSFNIRWSHFDKALVEELVERNPDAPVRVYVPEADSCLEFACDEVTLSDILHHLKNAPPVESGRFDQPDILYREIAISGLFDTAWYSSTYGLRMVGPDPLRHYITVGIAQNLQPSFYFDPDFYRKQIGPSADDIQPALLHYIGEGRGSHRDTSIHFDSQWYTGEYGGSGELTPLADFLRNRPRRNPNGYFDYAFYLGGNSDVASVDDPYVHFALYGVNEGRRASPRFDPDYYRQAHLRGDPVANPFEHFLAVGRHQNLPTTPPPKPKPVSVEDRKPAAATPAARPAADARALKALAEKLVSMGLIDEGWYVHTNSDLKDAGVSPALHYVSHGDEEGRKPNPYFDPIWYAKKYFKRRPPKGALAHYIDSGERDGNKPCAVFDPGWYAKNYGVDLGGGKALAHYLKNRKSNKFGPNPYFSPQYYISLYPDIGTAGIDAFEHYYSWGVFENREGSEEFNANFVWGRYLNGNKNKNPFEIFMDIGIELGWESRVSAGSPSVHREIRENCAAGPYFEADLVKLPGPARGKILAYYLTQFHAFPENDKWWGRGFTEWHNLPRGVPRFPGHYQPRTPRDLGFYSLDDTEIMRRQIEMAKQAGLFGFVYYYYYFNGQRLMEKPLEAFLADKTLDFPFAIMWANENWTRRWDGAESEVLISQDYRPEDDLNLTSEFARHFADPRYIRIGGRPVFMIYRVGIIPDARRTIERWRAIFREKHAVDPILIMAQSFREHDPAPFGLDGAIEFPPHKLTQDLPSINPELQLLDPDFKGHVYRYETIAELSLAEPPPAFPLIKTIVPSWDNDARRQGSGLVMHGSTPAKYEAWLSALMRRAVANPFFGEPFVCVNAWNEWCEGAYLEPDLHFGSAYLNATRRAVTGVSDRRSRRRLLLVGHDAFPSGAQLNLLNIGRTLRRCFGVDIQFLLLGGGALEESYAAVAPTHVVAGPDDLERRIAMLAEQGFANALLNTTISAGLATQLVKIGMEPVALIHELPRIMQAMNLFDAAKAALKDARWLVFAAPFVRDRMLAEFDTPADDRMLILPQGNYQDVRVSAESGAALRLELGIAERDSLLLGMGYADLRKGFDLFLQTWRLCQRTGSESRTHFCWVGAIDPTMKSWLSQEIAAATAAGTFHMPGFRKDVAAFYSAGSGLVLTSREDPFPTVALEALGAGLPVFAFAESGGIPDLLTRHAVGHVVPYGDTVALAQAIDLALTAGIAPAERSRRQALIADQFNFSRWVETLLRLTMPDLASVSVVVPNYNYARHMPDRLGTIFGQTHPVHEILVLDDCSTDASLEVIAGVAGEWNREIRLIPNEVNSGSVFAQWRKAAELAAGEFLWIAEADDLSDPTFLEKTLALFAGDPDVAFVFADSRSIDGDGVPIWPSYKGYYASVEPGALDQTRLFEGADFAIRLLSTKNLILNVSAVVWRRDALLRALDLCGETLGTYRVAGDWLLYLQALGKPGARVGYEADPLNVHRRHAQSVTHALNADLHVGEIAKIHGFVRETFPLSGRTVVEQDKYLQEVTAQLTGSKD
jgi:glycosyltransferase involved in cell wall biosynthesis